MRLMLLLASLCFSLTALAASTATERTEGALVLRNIPAVEPATQERLRPYMEARVGRFIGWLPQDGGMLTMNRFGSTNQLHLMRMPEGARKQITFFEEPIADAIVSPSVELNGTLFTKDSGGDEYFQLYFMDFATLRARRLSSGGQSRNERPLFDRSGERYAFSSTARNGRDFDILLGDLTSEAEPKLVLEGKGRWFALDFSPNGKELIVSNVDSITRNSLYLLDLNTGKRKPLFKVKDPSNSPEAQFSANGDGVYLLTDLGADATHVHHLDRKSGKLTELTDSRDWEVDEFDVTREGLIALHYNRAGESDLQVFKLDPKTHKLVGKAVAQLKLSPGVLQRVRFDQSGRRLGFALNGPQIPGDAAELDLRSGQVLRWTENETGGLSRDSLIVPQLLNAGSFDLGIMGQPRQVPAWYYQPPGAIGKSPVVIIMHGGPEGQARPTFDPFIQFLVRELGIAVIAPNVRGSSGYGRYYLSLDDGIKRMDSIRDMEAWIRWVSSRSELDASRVVVMGGSYGGFMSLAALANYSDYIAGAVSIVGISNLVSFLENTHPYRRDARRNEYGNEQDPKVRKVLEQVSPLTKVKDMSKPLFVIQGANDPRVPQSESDQIVAALSARGIDTWYLLAKNEGHGFKKKENINTQQILIAQWLINLFKL